MTHFSHRLIALNIAGWSLLLAQSAHAASFCVGTTAELRSAVQTAMTTPGDDEIRIRAGLYEIDASIQLATAQPGWLAIQGGYVSGGGLPCGARLLGAQNTVLDGMGLRQIMVLSYQPGAGTSSVRYYFDNLTFRRGVGTGFQRGGGLGVSTFGSGSNEIWLENLVFENNSGYFAGGLDAYMNNGMVRLVNSRFDNNEAPGTAYGHATITVVEAPAAYARAVVVANSHFTRGRCAGSAGLGYTRGCGIGIGVGTGLQAEVANTVFADNQIADVTIERNIGSAGVERLFVRDSVAAIINGTAPATLATMVTGDPRFIDPAQGNYRRRDDSPLINRGVLPIPGVYTQFNGYDITGVLRVALGGLDVGAYERQGPEQILRNGFE